MDIALTDDLRTIPINRNSVKGLCLRGFEHLDVTSIPFDEPAEENQELFKLMKSTKSRCTVCFDFTTNGNTYRIYVKRYRTWRWSRKLGYLFVPSKAMREWNLGHALLEKGFKTPIPVVAADLKSGPLVKENFLATLSIAPFRSAAEYLSDSQDPQIRKEFLEAMADYVFSFHDSGFYHDDLSAHHIFLHPERKPYEFALIDLDNSFFRKTIGKRLRIKNMFQILRSLPETVSPDERIFFLEKYFRAKQINPLIKKINAIAGKKNISKVVPDEKDLR